MPERRPVGAVIVPFPVPADPAAGHNDGKRSVDDRRPAARGPGGETSTLHVPSAVRRVKATRS